MCVTVRTLCLLVSSAPVTLSVERAVIHDTDVFPSESFRSLTKMVTMSVPHLDMVAEQCCASHSYLKEAHDGLDPRHLSRPACFVGTQEGSYDEWRLQPVAFVAAVDPRFGDVADEVARRTTPYLPTDLPPDKEGRKAYLMLFLMLSVSTHVQKQTDGTAEAYHAPAPEQCWFRCRAHRQAVRVAGGACVRADFWQGTGSDREDCSADGGNAATAARTSSVAFRRKWQRLQE